MRLRAIVLAVLLVVTATAAGGVGGVSAAVGGAGSPTVADAAAATQANCEYPITETDATGEEVAVEQAPERVIVLGGSAAQTAWEVGASDRVVGIDTFSTYLDGAADVPVVSQGQNAVQYEQALEQDPDMVIVAGDSYPDSDAEQFRDANVTTFKLPNAGSLDDIYNNTRVTGSLMGACEGAEASVSEMQEQVNVVEETVENADDRPSIYYPMGDGYTVGPGSFIDSVMERAGGENIVDEEFEAYPQVSEEFVVEEDPEWLLATHSPGQNASDPAALLPRSDAINQTQAYQDGNVIAVDTNNLNQPAPRVVEPMTDIARQLHPEAYAAANATTTTAATQTTAGTTDATTTESSNATTTGQTTTETTESDGLPGFGPAVAVVALVAAGLGLFRRRA